MEFKELSNCLCHKTGHRVSMLHLLLSYREVRMFSKDLFESKNNADKEQSDVVTI